MYDIINVILNSNSILLMTHNSPDGDGTGCLIALENILKQLSQDSKDLIAKEIANIDSYIDEKIEVVLAEIKLMDQQQNCSY